MSAGLDASTVTPGSTAPDASLTTPLMAACADATTGSNRTNPSTKIPLPILSTAPPCVDRVSCLSLFAPALDACREQLHAIDRIGPDGIEPLSVGTREGEVLRLLDPVLLGAPEANWNRAEVLALRTEDLDADVGRRIDAAGIVYRHSVGAVVLGEPWIGGAGSRKALVLAEIALVLQRAVRLHVERQDVLAILVIGVQRFLVAAQHNTVHVLEIDNLLHLTAGAQEVDALRVGEVDVVLGADNQVVQRVERLAIDLVRKRRHAGRRIEHGDFLARGGTQHRDQPPLRIPPEAIGAFRALDERGSVAVQIDFRNVTDISLCPENAAAVEDSDGSLGPLDGKCHELDVRAGGNDAGDRRRDDVLRRRRSLFPATAAAPTAAGAAATVLRIRDERNGRDHDEDREHLQIADPWFHPLPPIQSLSGQCYFASR